jgi:transcriptional regulator with XRE-family HTH domain
MDDMIRGADAQLLKELGALFAAARKSSALSLKAISDITRISPSHVLRMESGDQDFTVTKFSRLCDALGIPVGLVLEVSLLHTREFFQGGAEFAESSTLARKLFGGVHNESGAIDSGKLTQITSYSEAIEWLLVTTSRTVAALLLSADPKLLAREVHGPPGAVREKLIAFAERIDPLANVTERLGIIKSLKARPYSKLKSLGILDDKIVFDYIVSDAYLTSYEPSLNVGKYLLAEPEKSEPEKTRQSERLTIEANTLTTENVQPVLPKLIQRLKRATEERGKKVELAEWLGVHRQMVTDWLSGKQEPGGEITLQLLHWVEQQERQK